MSGRDEMNAALRGRGTAVEPPDPADAAPTPSPDIDQGVRTQGGGNLGPPDMNRLLRAKAGLEPPYHYSDLRRGMR